MTFMVCSLSILFLFYNTATTSSTACVVRSPLPGSPNPVEKSAERRELEKLLSKHDCLTTTKMDYKKFTFLLFFVFQPNWILGGDVICSLEDYVLTGIEFGDCQSEAMKSYGSDDDKARNPCSELKNVVDNCARLVSVSS